MFRYDTPISSTPSSLTVCSGCLCATVCKWRDKVIEAEAEINKKLVVNPNNSTEDVNKILNVKVTCNYKQTGSVSRLNGDYRDAIPTTATNAATITTGTIGTTSSYSNYYGKEQ